MTMARAGGTAMGHEIPWQPRLGKLIGGSESLELLIWFKSRAIDEVIDETE